jgi:hypothetical protein
LTSGTSATIDIPSPPAIATQASAIDRSTRSRAMNRTPAETPACSSCSSRTPAKFPCTDQASAAETTNDTAFSPNTAPAPIVPTSAPPISGPIKMPTLRPTPSRPFAHAIRSSSTRFGMAAADAARNGDSASADRNATNNNHTGSCTNAIAAKQTAPARSDTTITRLRSKRSPSVPANSPTNPTVPNVRNSAAATHAAEWVRW